MASVNLTNSGVSFARQQNSVSAEISLLFSKFITFALQKLSALF